MFICPNCQTDLSKARDKFGLFWACPSCHGRAVTLEVVRKVAPRPLVNQLWQNAQSGQYPRKRPCPACKRNMVEIPVTCQTNPLQLDVCRGCHFIWFDAMEYEDIPRTPPKTVPEKKLSPQAREKAAMVKLQLLQKKTDAKQVGVGAPDSWWEFIPALLGMPVEYNTKKLSSKPIMTWLLAALIAVISIISFRDLNSIVSEWGMIPAEFSRHCGLTFISSFFLHAGILHLVGNLYFLIIFGDNVEDVLGRWRYLFLIVIAASVGDLTHIIAEPSSATPCIGASGGISGIIAYYALRFPRTNIGVLIYFRWVRFPAMVMFLLWMLMQIFGVYMQLNGFSNVSALAHLGGAVTGVLMWLITRKSDT